ncbi:transposase family protein [bacterium]|nr:transposase family protein [bacterium]
MTLFFIFIIHKTLYIFQSYSYQEAIMFISSITRILSKIIFVFLSARKQAARKFLIQRNTVCPDCLFCPYKIENEILKSANAFMREQIKQQKHIRWTKTAQLGIMRLVHKFGIPHTKIPVYFPVARSTFIRWLTKLKNGSFFYSINSSRKIHPQKTPRAITIKKILRKKLHLQPPRIITSHPHQVWQMDITTVKIFWFISAYIFVAIDDYSRAVITFSVSLKPSADWIENILLKAFTTRGKPEAVRTDNGGQFISQQFKSFLKNMNISHLRCPPRYPLLNGKVERFFLSLKTELLNRISINSFRQLKQLVAEYIAYYNFYRPHQGINMQIPMTRLNNLVAAGLIPACNDGPQNFIPIKITRLTFAGILNAYVISN